MEWELEQLEKLEVIRQKYGWASDNPYLQARKKIIMKKALQYLKASSPRKKTSQRHTAEEPSVEEEAVRNPKIDWEDNELVFKASDWEALYKRLQKIAVGVWKRDKACPTSKLRGLVVNPYFS